ncbi:MAG TPA: bile acid:sodium symporter family protein [Sphingobium sp.]
MTLFGITFDRFLGALLAAIIAAIIAPSLGMTGGILHVDFIAQYGVGLVFFLYGLTLDPARMRAGLGHYRLHIIVQSSTFLLFPLIVLALHALINPVLTEEAWTGFFFVAALPSTVSSSVAMVSLARGNVPAAIFNATLSSLIGVLVTPALMAWYLSRSSMPLDLSSVIVKVLALVLLPIVLGYGARHWLAAWAARRKPIIQLADRGVIVAIVYNSFCDSIHKGVWSASNADLIIGIIIGAIALFALVYLLITLLCNALGFSVEDRIACTFCASKKSLATGAPMGAMMFGGQAAFGILIAPIILYHFCQLVITSVIASHFARSAKARDAHAHGERA